MKTLMEEEGLPYDSDRTMSYNSRLAQELAKWAETQGRGDAIHESIFRAYFVEGENIAKLDVLTGIALRAGLPAGEAADALLSRSFKDAVDRDWQRCARLGIDGVPTFLAGRLMMMGAHPYEDLEKLLLKASSSGR